MREREKEREREREREGKREKRRHKYKWTNAAMISCRPRKEAQAFTRLWRKFERKGSVLDSEVVCIFCPGIYRVWGHGCRQTM